MTRRAFASVVALRVLAGVATLAGAAAFVAFGLGSNEPPVAPQVAIVDRGPIADDLDLVGVLEAPDALNVGSTIRGDRGRLAWLIDDGARVAAGDVLARLDTTPFEEEVARLEAAHAEAAAGAEALRRALTWEIEQADAAATAAARDAEVVQLDLDLQEKGQGPLDLARLEREAADLADAAERRERLADTLAAMAERGEVDAAEAAKERRAATVAREQADRAEREWETFRDFVLPAQIKKAQVRLARAEQQIELTARQSAFDVERARQAVDAGTRAVADAAARLAEARQELAACIIRAPADGLVVLREDFRDGARRVPRVGDTVWQSQPILSLPDVARLDVRARVAEAELHKVAVGSAATVRLDAYPALSLKGEVASIGALVRRDESDPRRREFDVVVRLDLAEQPDAALRPGMTARCIVTRSAGDVLRVPLASIDGAAGNFGVWQLIDGEPVRRRVRVGLAGRAHAEVLDGLSVGDEILAIPPGASR